MEYWGDLGTSLWYKVSETERKKTAIDVFFGGIPVLIISGAYRSIANAINILKLWGEWFEGRPTKKELTRVDSCMKV